MPCLALLFKTCYKEDDSEQIKQGSKHSLRPARYVGDGAGLNGMQRKDKSVSMQKPRIPAAIIADKSLE